MTARGTARKRALEILYEAELRSAPVAEVLAARVERADPPVSEYAVTLVEGVQRHRERIDELIETYAEGWTLERMPAVDRNALRIGTFELLWMDDVPDAVAISEAIQLVKDLSTEDSPSFVNGLLGRFKQLKPSLTL